MLHDKPRFDGYSSYMRNGFSLVELSIVLVILGLLVGGILTGQSLIQAAQLRKVITQYDQIRAATNSFRDRYMGLPGDITNATSFWGISSDCLAPTSDSTTCNGDGSGRLAYLVGSSYRYEPWHFWKHLANAGLIPGTYTGATNSSACSIASYCLVPGENGLQGPMGGSGWVAFSIATNADKSWNGRAADQDRNILALGNPSNSSSGIWFGASLGAADQWNVDTKIDDGMPYTGKLVDASGTGSTYTLNCATANSAEFGNSPPGTSTNGAQYRLDRNTANTTEGCVPFFDL